MSPSDNGERVILDKEYMFGHIPIEIHVPKEEAEQILAEFPAPKQENASNIRPLTEYKDKDNIKDFLGVISEYSVRYKDEEKLQPWWIDFTCSNSAGSFKGKLWESNGIIDETLKVIEKHKVFLFSGKVNEYPAKSGNKSINIEKMTRVKEGVSTYELLPSTDKPVEELILELIYYVNRLNERDKAIAKSILKEYWSDFIEKPAAKGHHHNFIGGLLHHTVGLLRVASYILNAPNNKYSGQMVKLITNIQRNHLKDITEQIIADEPKDYKWLPWGQSLDHLYSLIYKFEISKKGHDFNPDVLLVSIIFHGIGKIFEYTHVGEKNKYKKLFPFASDIDEYDEKVKERITGITMDELGILVGHMPYGTVLFHQTLSKYKIPVDLLTIHEYMHNILSHHAKHEWGSSVVPMLPGAFILCFVDYVDAKFMSNK